MDRMSQTIADAFVSARRQWEVLPEYPGERPASLAAAYAIQDCALSVWNREIGGWKVGRIAEPVSTALGADRLAGPVFADMIRDAGGEPGGALVEFPIFERGFAAVEAEFMLRLSPREGALPITREEAMGWVDEVRIGIEIASSPYPGINTDGPCVTVSDHGNNAGLLLGRQVPAELWPRLDEIDVSLAIDGRQAGRATTATMLDGPFGAMCFLLANLRQRGIPAQPGWWVSSGAITGVHQIAAGQQVVAHFAGVGEARATIAPAR